MKKWMIVCCFFAGTACADTVILARGDSINGAVEFRDGHFDVSGLVEGHPYQWHISPEEISEIRMNQFDSNSTVPKELPRPRAPIVPKCEVVFRGNKPSKNGILQSIAKDNIQLAGQTFPKSSIQVLRLID